MNKSIIIYILIICIGLPIGLFFGLNVDRDEAYYCRYYCINNSNVSDFKYTYFSNSCICKEGKIDAMEVILE